jgi:hypothetical protein
VQGRRLPPVAEEAMMSLRFKVFAVAAVLAAGVSGAAMADYPCGPGYALYGGVCRPIGYSNPVSGAISGSEAGAANGYATGGPVGAAVGGAVGTATGTVAGTANMLSGGSAPPPARACAPGFYWYNGACYRR